MSRIQRPWALAALAAVIAGLSVLLAGCGAAPTSVAHIGSTTTVAASNPSNSQSGAPVPNSKSLFPVCVTTACRTSQNS